MIRHVVLLTLDPSTPQETLDELIGRLRDLPAAIPALRDYRVGLDLGLAEGNATVGVTADFVDATGWAAYRDHPEHVRIIEELIRPNLLNRTAVQYELV